MFTSRRFPSTHPSSSSWYLPLPVRITMPTLARWFITIGHRLRPTVGRTCRPATSTTIRNNCNPPIITTDTIRITRRPPPRHPLTSCTSSSSICAQPHRRQRPPRKHITCAICRRRRRPAHPAPCTRRPAISCTRNRSCGHCSLRWRCSVSVSPSITIDTSDLRPPRR